MEFQALINVNMRYVSFPTMQIALIWRFMAPLRSTVWTKFHNLSYLYFSRKVIVQSRRRVSLPFLDKVCSVEWSPDKDCWWWWLHLNNFCGKSLALNITCGKVSHYKQQSLAVRTPLTQTMPLRYNTPGLKPLSSFQSRARTLIC